MLRCAAAPLQGNPYRELFERLSDAVVILDEEHRIVFANRVAREQPAEALTSLFHAITTASGDSGPFLAQLAAHGSARAEVPIPNASAETRHVLLDGIAVGSGRSAIVVRDVTEHRALQAAVARLSRVDSLGYVTASVMHDFGNLMTPIAATATLLCHELESKPHLVDLAREIRYAAGRATALVRHLQTCLHRKPRGTAPADAARILTEMRPLLERLAGEHTELVLPRRAGPLEVLVDCEQFERVVLNLVANARDAMPRGGKLTIGACLQHLETRDAASRGCPGAGMYVVVSVSDTGVGMSAEVRARLQEQFFTTKGPGRGSGFGLTSARRFAQQHGGCIAIESEQGRGTTVTLHLPAAKGLAPG